MFQSYHLPEMDFHFGCWQLYPYLQCLKVFLKVEMSEKNLETDVRRAGIRVDSLSESKKMHVAAIIHNVEK